MFRFLLRFFAVFIACSAFVGLTSHPVFAYQVGTGNCPDPYSGNCGEIAPTDSSAPCDVNPLTFNTTHHENYGTYTLTAQYEKKSYTITYRAGSCENTPRTADVVDSVDFLDSYTIRGTADVTGGVANVRVPSGYSFGGWQATWYYDNGTTESGGVLQPDHQINPWDKPARLVLVAVCSDKCSDANYPSYDEDKDSCYTTKIVNCTPVPGTVPDNCLDTEENPAEWSESCTCNGVNSISYRVYENGTIAQEDGGDIPDQVAPTLTCSELLSATGAPGYNDYDPDLNQCPEIDTFELTFNCNDGHTVLDESDRQAGSLITIAREAPTCDQDVKNWTCESENSLVEATYSEGAITSFKMPNTNVICTANYEYKVDYYCSETTNVSEKQDAVMHGENYTWWNEPTSSTCSEASTKDFNGWSCTPGDTRSAGAQETYEWYQDMRCNATWTQKFPVYYDCANNGLGIDGNGTKPADSNSPYAADASVNVLVYPAGCQAPTEREADNQLGWECVAQDGTPVYSGSGNDTFNMPAQPVTCTAKWKSTAYNITYIGCKCNTQNVTLPDNCNVAPDKGEVVGQDITNKVVSGELVSNDERTYYRTYHRGRHVNFPTTVGTNYGQVNVANGAFNSGNNNAPWFIFYPNEYTTRPVTNNSTSQLNVDGTGDITVYTCLDDYYRVTYDCKDDNPSNDPKDTTTYRDNALVTVKKGVQNGQKLCDKPGYTFKWICDQRVGEKDPESSNNNKFNIQVDTKCKADWVCDTANGYVSDGNGQCVKKYNLTFVCANGKDSNQSFQLSVGATQDVVSCKTKDCSEPEYTWSCNPSSALSDNTVTMPAYNVTCTAQWTPTTKTVTYNSGNCLDTSRNVHSETVDCGLSASQSMTAQNNLDLTGSSMTFVGWTTDPTPTVAANSVKNQWSGGSVTNDITVYAACRCKDGYVMNDNGQCEKVYTVKYKVGECAASGAPYTDNSQLQSGVSYTVKDFDYVKSESSWNVGSKMKFIKWIGDNDGEYLDSNKNNWTFAWSGTSDLVLTAYCEDTSFVCPEEYNEYDDSFDDVTGCYKVVKVSCDQQDGQVPEHCKDPVWKACQCTQEVKYRVYAADADGNPGKMTDSTGNTILTDIPSAPTCTKTLGEGTGAEPGYSFDIETQTCPKESYELEYDCDNGEKTGDKTESHGYLDSISGLSGNANGCMAPADWQEFDYWVCEPSDNQKTLQQPQYDDDSYIDSFKMPDTNVTCTARRKNKQYKVTYDCTDGTDKQNPGLGTRGDVSDDGKQEIINNIVYNETQFTFTKVGDECVLEGYTPTGWDCNVSLKNTDYTGRKYSYNQDVTCNAEWKVEEYDLTYDCNNGGKGTEPAGGTYSYGQRDVPVEKGQGSCKSPKGQHFAGWTCDVEVEDYKFTMPRHNVVCRGGWEDSIEDITYVGCVNGTCVVRCNDGDCVSVDSSCEGEVLYLNPEVDPDKWTYSNTKVVYFPGVDEDPAQYLLDAGYKFSGIWNKTDGFRTAGKITFTKLQTGSLTMCTILEPYYKVTYNCGWDHPAPVDEKRYDSRETVTVKNGSDCGDRPGYSFTKWMCEPNGKTAFDKSSGQTFQIEANTTCTAQWKEVSYRVTYDCNGKTKKTNNMVDKPIYYGDSYTFSDIDERCLHEGYTFGGWECYKTQTPNDKDNYLCPTGGDTCPDSITWDFADNLKCKALWDVDYYDVIYDKGSCADAAGVVYTDVDGAAYGQNYTPSETVSGLMNTATKPGYTFVGWNTVSGQTTSNWTGEKPWARQSDLTVYAACTPNKYDVIYDKGACESKSGKNYTHKNGATYGTKYTALSGGSESSKTGIYAGTGYTFKGWSETQTPEFNDNGTLANPWTGEDPWLFTVTKTVYGICKPITYNVIYMKGTCEVKENTGDGTFTDSVEYNTNYTVLGLDAENMAITTKPGYVFKGWKASYASQVPDYQAGDEFAPWTRTSALTLWAVCEREPYHVEYDCDVYTSCDEDDDTGCRTPKDNKDYYINDSVSVPINDANTCKKLGWTFNDWNCVAKDENETSLPITVIGSYAKRFTMINADAICTAIWDEDFYHVTYDCNGGTNAPIDSAGYTYGTDVETYGQNNPQKLNTCEREGYDFTVWVCGEGEEAQTVAQGGVFENITHDTTCHAQWMPRTYDIIYDSGTCGGKMLEQEDFSTNRGLKSEYYSTAQVLEDALQYDDMFDVDDITDLDSLYVARGYEFLGWSTENGGTTEEDVDDNYSVGEHGPWTTDGDLTLYAVCKKKVYNVCYDFQVEHAGWKDKSAEPLYTYDVDTEMNSREVHLAVHKDVSNDRGEGKFYVFDGWYNMPGIYRDQNNSGPKITTVPDMNAEPLDTPVSLKCDGTIVSPQCDDSEYAKRDVVL
ncbi:MAG: InlB B-repeat-containing protein [Alphaproteobacteria bacterium]|nr:InlB B-repeat-containing protein [Alphaproteobacteria bacterium]